MKLVSFDPVRSLGLPGVLPLKPEELFAHRSTLEQADWVLFPRSWQLNALAYGFGCRVFPSVATYSIGYDKVETARAFLAVAPEHVPQTLILPASPESAERAMAELGLPLVAKLPRAARGEGVVLIERRSELRRWVEQCGDVLLVQEYLPSPADLRVVVVGREVVSAYWRRGGLDFRHNVARGAEIDPEGVPAAAVELVERVAGRLGIDYGGFDVLWAHGHPWLIELNVLFGLQGVSRLGIPLAPKILAYLEGRDREDRDPTRPPRPQRPPRAA